MKSFLIEKTDTCKERTLEAGLTGGSTEGLQLTSLDVLLFTSLLFRPESSAASLSISFSSFSLYCCLSSEARFSRDLYVSSEPCGFIIATQDTGTFLRQALPNFRLFIPKI